MAVPIQTIDKRTHHFLTFVGAQMNMLGNIHTDNKLHVSKCPHPLVIRMCSDAYNPCSRQPSKLMINKVL